MIPKPQAPNPKPETLNPGSIGSLKEHVPLQLLRPPFAVGARVEVFSENLGEHVGSRV